MTAQKKKHPTSKKNIQALIFDLDGVITRTRQTHKKAWRELFDRYFSKYNPEQPHMSEEDYLNYIDGKPRFRGIESFLESRNIELALGNESSQPGLTDIYALGNLKNQLFNNLLDTEGVKVYDDALEKLKKWKQQGYKTALVSSSRNCKKIADIAGISRYFDVRVDGELARELNLHGKPHPDIFTEAARQLQVAPGQAVVFEDATSGVEAGQKGFFGLVVGVDRFGNEENLLKHGADVVIKDFSKFSPDDKELMETYIELPATPVFPHNKELFERLSKRKPAIFLDYDGTLTPIVSRPEDAILSNDMRESLQKLAEKFTVAIVTGRDKEDVEKLVNLEQLIYAGSHGYIISGPDGLQMEHPDSEKIIPVLDEMEKKLTKLLEEQTEGALLDRKRYAIGIHFRNARPQDEDKVYALANRMLEEYPGHKLGEGKKIVEIKPDLDWHKGKAVTWILQALKLENPETIPVFIGDDVTDEDAFEEIKDHGIGILVGGHGKETAAAWSLKNVFQVKEFFKRLINEQP